MNQLLEYLLVIACIRYFPAKDSQMLLVSYSNVISFIRCIIKNFLGTYNNQYVVLDLKKIKLKERIEDNALWIVEQIPG